MNNYTRRQALGLTLAGLAYLTGCEAMQNPMGPEGAQGQSFDENSLPKPKIVDPLAGIGADRKLFFFRMDGTYLGVVNYKKAKHDEKEPEYSLEKLLKLSVKVDVKTDKYYAILEEPEKDKIGKVIVKPRALLSKDGQKEHLLEIPAKKTQEKQWYAYMMAEAAKDDDKGYLNALKWKEEQAKKEAEEKNKAEEEPQK